MTALRVLWRLSGGFSENIRTLRRSGAAVGRTHPPRGLLPSRRRPLPDCPNRRSGSCSDHPGGTLQRSQFGRVQLSGRSPGKRREGFQGPGLERGHWLSGRPAHPPVRHCLLGGVQSGRDRPGVRRQERHGLALRRSLRQEDTDLARSFGHRAFLVCLGTGVQSRWRTAGQRGRVWNPPVGHPGRPSCGQLPRAASCFSSIQFAGDPPGQRESGWNNPAMGHAVRPAHHRFRQALRSRAVRRTQQRRDHLG